MIISTFALSGFEHVVANMYTLPLGYWLGAPVSWNDIFRNLGIVTVGNYVGGGIMEEEGEGEGPAHGVVPGAKKRVTNHASTAAELVYDHRGGWFHWAPGAGRVASRRWWRAGRATAHREDAGSRSDDASPASRKGAGRDRDDRDADGAAAAGAGLPGAVPSAFTVPVVAVSLQQPARGVRAEPGLLPPSSKAGSFGPQRVAFGDPSPALEKELGDL
eukprot:tig00021070_g17896.t1